MTTINRLLGVCLLMLSCTSFASSINTVPTAPVMVKLNFQPAKACSRCHAKIYNEWQTSWMAKAYTNSVFQTDLARFLNFTKDAGESPTTCLRCHAPAAVMTSDDSARQSLSREGVTCEICHRVAMVRIKNDRHHLVIDPRNIQYGRSKEIASTSHAVKFSKALDDSSVCAGCHLDIQDSDAPLERTYREWAESTYSKEGVQCRTCHMPDVSGPATLMPGRPVSSRGKTHASHQFQGGHANSSLLHGAAEFSLKYDKAKQELLIDITNNRVGHNFPTGGAHPAELVLELDFIDAGGKTIHQIRRLHKLSFLNMSVPAPSMTGDPAQQLIRDTTLKPLESRQDIIRLAVLPAFRLINAVLVYYLLPKEASKYFAPGLLKKDYRPTKIASCTLYLNKGGSIKSCRSKITD